MKPQRWTRREHDRFEIFECALVQRDRTHDSERAMIVDVSLGGFQIRSQRQLEVGESVRVKIGRDEGAPMFLRAEVRYSRFEPESNLFATGLRFNPESHEERLVVARYLNGVVLNRMDS